MNISEGKIKIRLMNINRIVGYNVIWFILLIIIYVILKFIPFGIFSDMLNLKDVNHNDLLDLIISTTGAIFGVFFALLIISLELTKQRTGKLNFELLLFKGQISKMGTLLVLTIILSFATKLIVKNINTNNDLNLIYYSVILFIISIVSLFPFTIRYLKNINSDYFIKNKIINEDFDKNNESIELIEEAIRHHIRIGDYSAVKKTITLLKDRIHYSDATNERIWNQIIEESIICNRLIFLEYIWEDYYYSVNNWLSKEDAICNIVLSSFFSSFIEKYAENNIINNLKISFSYLYDIIIYQLKTNCPKEEKIFILNYEYNNVRIIDSSTNDNSKWINIKGILSNIFSIIKLAINNKNKLLFKEYIQQSDLFLMQVLKTDQIRIGELQETDIVLECIKQRTYFSLELVKNKTVTDSEDLDLLNDSLTIDLKDKSKYFSEIMKMYSDFIIKCSLNYKIDMKSIYRRWFFIMQISIENYDKDIQYATIFDITVEVVKIISKNISQESNSINNIYLLNLIESLCTQLNEKENNFVLEKLDSLINCFKQI